MIDDAMTSMSFEAIINSIDFTGTETADTNDNLTVAHIHGPAAPGVGAGVIWGFIGLPFNDTDPTDVVVTLLPPGSEARSPRRGTSTRATTPRSRTIRQYPGRPDLPELHTTQFGGGEIRGQILVVPEPETYLLMLAGLAGIGAIIRKRRAASNKQA